MNHDQKRRIVDAAATAAAGLQPIQQQQVAPIMHILQNCIPQGHDVKIDGANIKRLIFVHTSGVVAYQVDMPRQLARDLGTFLCAHPDIQIANGTPGPA